MPQKVETQATAGSGRVRAKVAPHTGLPPLVISDALLKRIPNLRQWPQSWACIEEEEHLGWAVLAVLIPFFAHLLERGYAPRTFARHRGNLWLLGGELVNRRRESPDLGQDDARALLLELVDDCGGPFIPKHLSEREQGAFDATCRQLYQYLEAQT